jgi:protocatechuate 3,4-dioxygenase beta subunit
MSQREGRILMPTSPIGRLPTMPEHDNARRRLLGAALALGAIGIAGRNALAQDTGFDPSGPMPTPDQILGPFYPVRKPMDGGTDLTKLKGRAAAAKGQPIYVMGRVLSVRGKPAPGVRLEIWQANAAGKYTHPHDLNKAPIDPNFEGYANVVTDAEGRFRFKTVKPGSYPVTPNYTRPPHIHFDITGRVNRLITQMYFPGEALNDRDPLLQQSWAKDSLIAKVLPPTASEEPDSQLVVWDIVLIEG